MSDIDPMAKDWSWHGFVERLDFAAREKLYQALVELHLGDDVGYEPLESPELSRTRQALWQTERLLEAEVLLSGAADALRESLEGAPDSAFLIDHVPALDLIIEIQRWLRGEPCGLSSLRDGDSGWDPSPLPAAAPSRNELRPQPTRPIPGKGEEMEEPTLTPDTEPLAVTAAGDDTCNNEETLTLEDDLKAERVENDDDGA